VEVVGQEAGGQRRREQREQPDAAARNATGSQPRRFRYLNTRNLLHLQAELISLETKLQETDSSLAANARTDILGSWEAFSQDEGRRKLAQTIRERLHDYSTKS
jgi:hypothetical protein